MIDEDEDDGNDGFAMEIHYGLLVTDEDEDVENDGFAMEIHYSLRLSDRDILYASYHNISWHQPGPRDTSTCDVGQVMRATFVNSHP